MCDSLLQSVLNEERFVELLRKLISEVEFLQDNPPTLIPEEERAAKHVMETLKPYSTENGGPLKVEYHSFTPKRGNVIITYPGSTNETVAFIGSHMDVVPATPETWDRNPFELSVEGDQLFGRGTTDCLGHVALITDLFCALAELKPQLKTTVVAVFIASEEAEDKPGVGVDGLMKAGLLDFIKAGPVMWIDMADTHPCIGTAGVIQWHLKVEGKLFHSGLPHRGINSIELANEAVAFMQDRFYKDFPPHEKEKLYNFTTPSTMKPTQISCAKGGLNQLPPHTTVSGDVRLTPFYKMSDLRAKVQSYVDELNENVTELPSRGPCSKYELEDGTRGEFTLTWEDHGFPGIACSLDSPGHKVLLEATKDVMGEVKPYSICGSLPLVREMQESGLDVQIAGYGLSATYHADNEYCQLSDMKNAHRILMRIVTRVEAGQE